jgi:2-oxo-3-hexenedioate decarboxylase/2-keto-4-pentenoate hydratase
MADAKDQAAQTIAEARLAKRRFAGLPVALRPAGETAAYDIQDALQPLLSEAGHGEPAGFKIGCTTEVMQRYLGIDHPCAGYVHARRIFASGTAFAATDYVRPGVECEIAVELARDLPAAEAPFDRTRVAAAVGAVRPAIEVVDDRYLDWRAIDAATLVADDFFHAALVLGPRLADWRDLDLAALRGRTRINGAPAGEGRGADVLGDPLNALAWLANHRASRGQSLAAGTVVSLGSLTETRWLVPGDGAEIEIERLGAVRLSYGAAVR